MKVLAFGRVGLSMDLYFGISCKSGPEVQIHYHETSVASLNMKPIKIERVLNYLDWEYSQMCFGGNGGGGYEVLG